MANASGVMSFSHIKMLLLALTVVLSSFHFSSAQKQNRSGEQQSLKQILDTLFSQYDRAIRPFHGEKPIDIGISLHVTAFDELNDENLDFKITLYLRQRWNDPRLTFRLQQQRQKPQFGLNNTIYLDEAKMNLAWIPDTFVVNAKKAFVHQDTSPNEVLRLQGNGTVLKSARYTMTLGCAMNFKFFPFDTQICPIQLESFAGNTNDVRITSDNSSVSFADTASSNLIGFKVLGYSVHNSEVNSSTGNHSTIRVNFVFQRSYTYFILRFYIPVGFSVIISLFSLLLARSVVEPLLHVVTICFVIWYRADIRMLNFPSIPYFTALDIYFFICCGHLAVCLLLSLIVSCRERNSQRETGGSLRGVVKPLTELDAYRNSSRRQRTCCNGNSILLCCLKWLVIGSFAGFNIVYWVYCRHIYLVVNRKFPNGTISIP